jgi:ABC-type dipeptide/oligopeptide/nickel transport system ATPase component
MKISWWVEMEVIKESFDNIQLIIFSGVSGSGKSTTMQSFLSCHPEYQNEASTVITDSPITWTSIFPSTRLVVIDELVNLSDYWHLIRLLHNGHRVIAASHFPDIYLRLLALIWRIRVIRVDKDYRTIVRYLQKAQIRYSDAAVQDFCSVFGASYADTKIVLEQYPSCSFDVAWSRFKRTSFIIREPVQPRTTNGACRVYRNHP